VQALAEVAELAAEASKTALKTAQLAMTGMMPVQRNEVMNDVARANYANDGTVAVDLVPLADGYLNFEGKPFMQNYGSDERERFKQATVGAANLDSFVRERRWKSTAWAGMCTGTNGIKFDYMRRAGGTELVGYDEWRALDTNSMWTYHPDSRHKCVSEEEVVAYGGQKAKSSSTQDDGGGPGAGDNPQATEDANNSGNDWSYSGLPNFFDLSDKALAYVPENGGKGGADSKKLDPKVRFAVRVTRASDQTATSDARSAIRGSKHLNAYAGDPARGVYAGVSASEVFFMRPDGQARRDGNSELASLFNPYWQAHLVDASGDARTAQLGLQGVAAP